MPAGHCQYAILLISAIVATACSTEHPSVAVTTPSPGVIGLAIVGLPSSAHVADAFQLSTVAAYSDGSHQSPTAGVTWASKNLQVVTLSQSGLARIVGPGDAEVLASYGTVDASAHVLVTTIDTSQLFTIRGVIHENWPRESVIIDNARIEVIGGPLDRQIFSGGPDGHFQLPPVGTPGFQLKFKKQRYDDASVDIVELPRDEMLEVALPPAFVLQRTTIEGTFQRSDCPNYPPGAPTIGGCVREFGMTIRHAGTVAVEYCSTEAFEDYIAWLRRGSVHIGEWINCGVAYPYPQGWPVEPGDVYTFQVFGDLGGHYRATFSYPN
jgi:hypothetical protein